MANKRNPMKKIGRAAKLFALIVAGIFAAVSISGCTPKEVDAGQQQEATLPADTEAPVENEPAAEPGPAEQDWEALYEPTLEKYRAAHKSGSIEKQNAGNSGGPDFEYLEGKYPEYLDEKDSTGSSWALVGLFSAFLNYSLDNYTIYDIDNNGIPELIIGQLMSNGEYYYADIADIYTLKNDVPIALVTLSAWYGTGGAGRLYQGNDGKKYIIQQVQDEGWGNVFIYSIGDDGASVKQEARFQYQLFNPDLYTKESFEQAYPGFAYGSDVYAEGDWESDPLSNQKLLMAEDEFNRRIEHYNGGGEIVLEGKKIGIFIGWDVNGGIYVRSEPVVDGEAGKMDDGNKIAYIQEGRTDVVLVPTGITSVDDSGFLWHEVDIPLSFRNEDTQKQYYDGKPLTGWVRDDVISQY